MIITYLRSSSYANWDYCQHQYFINYVLGIGGKAGVRADKGTCAHKVFECLANIKKQFQDEQKNVIVFYDEILSSPITIQKDDFLKEHILTDKEIYDINRTRINKYTYLTPCQLKHGHKRYGIDLVDILIQASIAKYSDENWKRVDKKDVENFVWLGLDYRNGIFDPRKRNILQSEKHFDIVIEKDWAKYDYGDKKGFLAIKGTIDLITEVDATTLEIIDWKTGQRKNWATGAKKDYKYLQTDFQLMMYYYAAKHLYPDKDIFLTIFFVRDGGPFTICFDESQLVDVEYGLAERFNEIRKSNLPKLLDPTHKDFRCEKLCSYKKMSSPLNPNQTYCHFIHDEIKTYGIEETIKKHQNINFNIHDYEAPGD